MKHISTLFQQSAQVADEQPDDILLHDFLEQTDSDFRSVAYEAAAMSRAISSLSENENLERWSSFLLKFPQHAVQIHIGLGWAFSQKKLSPIPFLSSVESVMHPRTLDGLGYSDATFRQRVVIQNKSVPEHFTSELLRGYDQGVGRALWYVSQGSPTRLLELINSFPEERRSDLWRGTGIAVAYVGGFDETILDELRFLANLFFDDLKTGTILATSSRFQANTLNKFSELICNYWFKLSAIQVSEITKQLKGDTENYFTHLAKINSALLSL